MARNQLATLRTSNLLVITVYVLMSFVVIKVYITWRAPIQTSLPPVQSENQFLETPLDISELLKDTEKLENDVKREDFIDGEITEEIKDIIDEMKAQIGTELQDYKLPSFRDIEGLFREKGGTPVRSLVITTWRSGSTFIGGVLNSHPATFHFSEPLTEFKTVQVRAEPLASVAMNTLRDLLTCDYQRLENYLKRSRSYTWLFTHNTRLWEQCERHHGLCWQPHFLRPVCRLFPFQSMKVVHIRLRLLEDLLADPEMNVKVVYLVRDPRAVLHSRSSLDWCMKNNDCGDPTRVCADFVDDYGAALRFTKLFPGKFMAVRYEDMSLRPEEVIPGIFNFFGIDYHRDVEDFVKKHTSQAVDNNRYSTFRNSSETALIWRKKSQFSKVSQLQNICRVALSSWGYLPAFNATHLQTFNPLVEPFHLP